MIITLKKGSTQQDLEEGRPHKRSILQIERDDGSIDWDYINPGLLTHDLAHYAVETVLLLKHGFFGIINQGASISEFELPKEEKPVLVHSDTIHKEALISEHLVNLVQSEIWNTGTIDDFLVIFQGICDEHGLTYPSNLNIDTLNQIREEYSRLSLEFLSLKQGEQLQLTIKDWKP